MRTSIQRSNGKASARWWRVTVGLVAATSLSLVIGGCASNAAAPEATTVPSVTPAITAGAPASRTATLTSVADSPGNQTSIATPLAATATPLAAVAVATVAPATTARIVTHGDPSRRVVALTFDAGADAGYTGEILDVLQRENVRATFGITGLWAEHNRDLLLAIAAQGHQIINHTYDHASFTGLSTEKPPLTAAERALELSRTEVTVYHLTQRSTRPSFRPPYGDLDASVARDAATNGYDTIVMWSVDTQGWKHASADAIVERGLAGAESGAIYVMHVGAESQDAVALPRLIDGLRAAGYAFATIDELLR